MHQIVTKTELYSSSAFIAQLGERQTEDLEVPSSILGEGTFKQQLQVVMKIRSTPFARYILDICFCLFVHQLQFWVECAGELPQCLDIEYSKVATFAVMKNGGQVAEGLPHK